MADGNGFSLHQGEVIELANLASSEMPQLAQFPALELQPICDMLSCEMIRNFIFDSAPLHLEYLSAVPLKDRALICSNETIGVEPVPPIIPLEESAQLHAKTGHILFVPAYSFEYTTVGVGVHSATVHARTSSIPLKCEETGHFKVNMRFACDARSNTLLMAMHDPQSHVYFIMSVQLETSCVIRVFSGFFGEALGSRMRAARGCIEPEHLRPFFRHAQYETPRKRCCICGGASCLNCLSKSTKARHPRDWEFFHETMAHHLGLSCTPASVIRVSQEQGLTQSIIGSRLSMVSMNIATSMNVVNDLVSWSLSGYERNVQPSPLQQIPTQPDLPPEFNVSEGRYAQNLHLGQPLLDNVAATWASAENPCRNNVTEHAGQTSYPNADHTTSAEQLLGTLLEELNRYVPPSGVVQPQHGEAGPSHQQPTALPMPFSQGDLPINGHLVAGGRGIPLPPTGRRRRAQNNPQPLTEEDKERIRKEEEKKERNRESARRSNKRQKDYREMLKSQLDNGKQEVETLRRKELRLRDENRSLRTAFRKFCEGNK